MLAPEILLLPTLDRHFRWGLLGTAAVLVRREVSDGFRCDRPPYGMRRWSRGPRSQSLDVVLQGQLTAPRAGPKPQARWWVKNPMTDRPCSTPGLSRPRAAPEFESVRARDR